MIECAVGVYGPETCATLAVQGPFEQIPEAFGKAYGWLHMAWITDQDLEVMWPPMEAYLNDPGELSPEEYLTEVMMPVRERS